MAKWRVLMQPTARPASSTTQDQRYAIPTGAAKTVVIWCNVFENGGTPTITIYGASSINFNDGVQTNPFWRSLGTIAPGASATGAAPPLTLTNPPAYLKWGVGTVSSLSFELIAEMWDT